VNVVRLHLLGHIHAAYLNKPAEGNGRDLKQGAFAPPTEQSRTKTQAESLDTHVAPLGDQVVPGFVNNYQHADGDDGAE
jgi:hypothetical protein